MNEIKLFENPEFGRVRVVMRGEDPWFVAKDVCECLGLDQVTRALTNLDDDEKYLLPGEQFAQEQKQSQSLCTLTISNPQENSGSPTAATLFPSGINVVSESGLYSLILRSRKPEAKVFKRWVTHDVLPTIRKTGGYGQAPQTYLEALKQCVALEEARLAAEAEKQKAQTALTAEQAAHVQTQHDLLDAQYDRDQVIHMCHQLSTQLAHIEEAGALSDMRSAYDMQWDLKKYFDVHKYKFYFFMGGFMTTLCHGGIRRHPTGEPEYILPDNLLGNMFPFTKRESMSGSGPVSIFPTSAWALFLTWCDNNPTKISSLPCIGVYAKTKK